MLVGYFSGGELIYAGKVGTGFDRATLGDLAERLARLERAESAFAGHDAPRRGVTWVEPDWSPRSRSREVVRERP